MNESAHAVSQFEMPSYEISVLMRQKYVADLKLLLARIVDVLIHIALRVHHRGNTRAGISNEI